MQFAHGRDRILNDPDSMVIAGRHGKLDFFLTSEKFEEARYDPETNRTIRHETQSISIH